MLCNFEEAVREFSTLFDEATKKHDLRLRELLWLEMQRFLPGEQSYDPLEDVVRPLVARFRTWYTSKLDSQYEIGCRGIQYLIDNERALEADERLNTLLHQFEGNLEKQYKLFNLRGNARMKIPGRVQEAEVDFQQALKCAHSLESSGVWGQAHKEIGFYYRNIGRMSDAAQAYLEALRITPLREQEELASIHTNSAYVQALRGEYEEALSLAETALAVRRRLNLQRETGMTLSVKGEALRYMRNFALAWGAYQEAAGIFEAAGNWPWLGMVYQEQAICLFQAASAGVKVEKYKDVEEMRKRARELSLQALAICRDMSIRGYPSALNRAARILSDREPDQALMYLKEGIRSAEEIGDGWFFFANVVEFAEICYQAWLRTGDIAYRDQIQSLSSRAEQAQKDYRFLDLSGRWNLLQGYLATHDALEGDNKEYSELMLNDALEYYKRGFAQEVRSYFGSHNATAISFEFDRFGRLLAKLPLEVRESWYVELIKAWSDVGQDYIEDLKQSTKLVTQLSRIYSEYVGDPQQEVAS
jgi:tetratricopeptide (TPR) repeat protein